MQNIDKEKNPSENFIYGPEELLSSGTPISSKASPESSQLESQPIQPADIFEIKTPEIERKEPPQETKLPQILKPLKEKGSTFLPHISWKVIFIGLGAFIVTSGGYYAYRYYKEVQQQKKFLEERKKVKIELPITISTSPPSLPPSTPIEFPVTTPTPVTTSTSVTTSSIEAPQIPVVPPITTETIKQEKSLTTTTFKELSTETRFQPPSQPKQIIQGEIIKFENIKDFIVYLKSFDENGLKEALDEVLKHQGRRFTFENIRLVWQNRDVSGKLVQEYFLKPSFADQSQLTKFLQSLTLNYAFLMYYTYASKYPIYIFQANDPIFAKTFISLWEKEGLLKDSTIFYLGKDRGRAINKFSNNIYLGVDYRIIKFSNSNFALIWTVYNDFVIFATNEEAFKKFVSSFLTEKYEGE